jgi:hypothetical protein
LKEGRVEAVPPSKPEIDDMRAIVARSLTDSALPLFPDNKFSLVYNAARTLAAMAVYAAGYRVKHRGGGHYNTLLALRAAMGPSIHALADYLEDCREKRNELSYEAANVVTETEANELVTKTQELQTLVEAWIGRNYPHLKA